MDFTGDGPAKMLYWRDDQISDRRLWSLVFLTNLVASVAIYVCITHQLWRHPPYFPRHTVTGPSYSRELKFLSSVIKLIRNTHHLVFSSAMFLLAHQAAKYRLTAPDGSICIYYLVHIILTKWDLRLIASTLVTSAVELFTREIRMYII